MFITPFNVCFRAFNKIVLNNFLREKIKFSAVQSALQHGLLAANMVIAGMKKCEFY
ncbi:hypothetical protein ECSTEC7V_3662 [Escherichia coli STEC_7v]|nr:hypothetical protein ECSTEC7V_3662 [Escherichia coli STEC_7v]